MGMKLPQELVDRILATPGVIDYRCVAPVAPASIAPKVSEKDFMAVVVKLANRHGWKCYHTFDSRRSATGFPDLVLVRERVIFAELKVDGGRLSAAQAEWIEALQRAGQLASVWTPDEWAAIEVILSAPFDVRDVQPSTLAT